MSGNFLTVKPKVVRHRAEARQAEMSFMLGGDNGRRIDGGWKG
jgi:hypothetical protein